MPTPSRAKFSSVTRWLLVVVIGCAVLETAQPMSAAGESDAVPSRSPETVLYPQGSPDRPDGPAKDTPGSSSFLVLGAVLLAIAGGWMILKKRGYLPTRRAGGGRLIAIEETRSLGSRQYLVVAGCEGRRFLLGVTPGRIQLLTPLEDAADAEESVDGVEESKS